MRARSGRRPIPPLIFLLVLALAALGVWWNVLQNDRSSDEVQAEPCATAAVAPPSLDPTTVTLRVLNATDTPGLAGQVAGELQARGFVVGETANDSSGREVSGVGELRHGPRGNGQAAYLTLVLPDAGDFVDTRADAVVDVVLGPDFQGLAPPDTVAAGLAPSASAAPAC